MGSENDKLSAGVRRVEDAERAFFAGYYAERRYHPGAWRLRLQRDLKLLTDVDTNRPLGRVLSVGCGDGTFELMLAARADSVLGVDLSPEAIDMARRTQARDGVRNVDFRCLSVADLELTERFDTIICVAFLHHLPVTAMDYFLSSMHGRLQPGGLFYSQDPNVHGIMRFIGRRLLGGKYDTYHSPDERELDPAETAAALRTAGFSGVAVRYMDLTLIPSLYFAPRGPDLMFRLFALLDRVWTATPLAPWASGFCVTARKVRSGEGA
jgi:SAM-dependent methyltransferase